MKTNMQFCKRAMVSLLWMVIAGISIVALSAYSIDREIMPEQLGKHAIELLRCGSIFVISWITAKKASKNRMQLVLSVTVLYLLICILVGRIVFHETILKLDIWVGASVLSAVLACLAANLKKERRR